MTSSVLNAESPEDLLLDELSLLCRLELLRLLLVQDDDPADRVLSPSFLMHPFKLSFGASVVVIFKLPFRLLRRIIHIMIAPLYS
jgi:hypothetical protein